MRLIFLYGMPASGKLTVARELAALIGFKLFHNHLAVDLLLSVFDFGTPPFVELREQIWLRTFEQAARSGLDGMIFTFAPEPTVRPGFTTEARRLVHQAGGTVDFVELLCPVDEIKRRLTNESRKAFGKLTSLDLFERMDAAGSWDCSAMPQPRLRVDTSVGTAQQTARKIARECGLLPA